VTTKSPLQPTVSGLKSSGHTETISFRSRRSIGKARRQRHEEGLKRGHPARVARLLALAHRLHDQLAAGEYRDYADIARQHHLTRARVTQIMNLLLLAPAIQEEILFLEVPPGRQAISERTLRAIAATLQWKEQQTLWSKLALDLPADQSQTNPSIRAHRKPNPHKHG